MIRVWWWRKPGPVYNLGDEITSSFLSGIYKVDHKKSTPFDANLYSTGSVLNGLYKDKKLKHIKESGRHVYVVGSGLMSSMPRLAEKNKESDFIKISSVRGYLTKNLLGVDDEHVSVGDPGLLASRLVKGDVNKATSIGIIPHHTMIDNASFRAKIGGINFAKIIDFRTQDYESVFHKMMQCELILSQGLHGLIFADSLGIPNAWLDFGDLHSGGNFKFYDYFSSIGRDFEKKINIKNSSLTPSLIKDSVFHELSRARLAVMQENIDESFKSSLKCIKNELK